MHDLGMAIATLLLQAQSMDIYGRMMGGYNRELVIEKYSIPDTFEPGAVIALGYLGDLDNLNDELRNRESAPRSRKSVSDFAFRNSPFHD